MVMAALADRTTQVTEVAQRLGLDRTTLYLYVNGDGTPTARGHALLSGPGPAQWRGAAFHAVPCRDLLCAAVQALHGTAERRWADAWPLGPPRARSCHAARVVVHSMCAGLWRQPSPNM